MPRTPAQRTADENLIRAIEQVMRAYDLGDQPFALSEFMVIAGSQGLDEFGDPVSATDIFYRDGHMPLHRALGLATYAAELLSAAVSRQLTDSE